MKLLVIFALCVVSSFSLELQTVSNFDEAIKQAKQKNKNLLVFMHSEHCPWCTKMKDTTLKDTETIEFINNRYIFVSLDKDTDKYPKHLKPEIIPTTYLIDQNTQDIKYTLYGYKPTEYLINELWDE